MGHLRLLLLIALLPAIQGCDDGHTPAPGASAFFPSGTGATWTYRVTNTLRGPDSGSTFALTIRVVGTSKRPGGGTVSTWAISCPDPVALSMLFRTGDAGLLRVRDDGDSVWMSPATDDLFTSYLLKPPLTMGKEWDFGYGQGFYVKVDSVSTVLAGGRVYDGCSHVFSTGGWWQAPEDRRYWFRESVGLIRGEIEQGGLINVAYAYELTGHSPGWPR